MINLYNALGAEKLLPETIILKNIPFAIALPMQQLHGMDGAVVTDKAAIQPRQISLEGRIYYPGDKGRIEQELDSLLAFLMHPPIEVYREHYQDRHLIAYPLGAPQDWIDRGAELALQIPMVAPDPYFYGQEVMVEVSDTQVIDVSGTAPTWPVITTADSVVNLHVANGLTGKEFTVSSAGGVVEVDCFPLNLSVKVDGENALDLIDDTWKLCSWELLPGNNQITTSAPIALVYRPRWY